MCVCWVTRMHSIYCVHELRPIEFPNVHDVGQFVVVRVIGCSAAFCLRLGFIPFDGREESVVVIVIYMTLLPCRQLESKSNNLVFIESNLILGSSRTQIERKHSQ